jgi:hypothetical protein
MDVLTYAVFAVIYLMIIHFAVAIKGEFNIYLMVGFFVLGGMIGQQMGNLEAGFILAIVLSLVFW